MSLLRVFLEENEKIKRSFLKLSFIKASNDRLTQMKEKTLITQINRLIDRDISSTNQIIRNLTKEMIQESIDKN